MSCVEIYRRNIVVVVAAGGFFFDFGSYSGQSQINEIAE